ncbi:MAG: hypothetical protein R3254_05095 [Thiomicrorhabdus sp.]|nr:hypothetical protein [Thiomicrorhabdus sp.]
MKYDGVTIHSVRDEYGLIEVVQNRSTRKLHFDSPIEQSCLYLNAPMTLNFEYQEKMVERVLAYVNQYKKNQTVRVLMLGMGGGSMAHHLFHTLPNIQMTVVELRQAVIDCAYQYFQLPDEPEIEVVCDDAISFVANNNSQAYQCEQHENAHLYDVIMVDIFDAHGLPSELSDKQFQENLWQNTHSPGLVIFNLWYQWNQTHSNGKPVATEETQKVMDFWQNRVNENAEGLLNRYNVQSSQNLIAEILKT